ncbi:MAG: superinfection immunity protein [Aestuariibacter sp.]|nr:superinfection immunity protein [Aestuariibacter sp.]
MSQSISVVTIAVIAALYVLPMVIAIYRDHHQTLVIVWINLLLGWSGLGWLLAFFWALTAVRRTDEPKTQAEPVQTKAPPAWPLPPQ